MSGVVRMWANSAAMCIPATVLEAAGLGVGQAVKLFAEKGRIVIAPIDPARCDAETLAAGITDEDRHDPIAPGPPVGREVC